MNRSRKAPSFCALLATVASTAWLLSTPGCGGGQARAPVGGEAPAAAEAPAEPAGEPAPAEGERTAKDGSPAEGAPPSEGSKPEEAKPAEPSGSDEAKHLARELVKGGGRRIGYSATRNGFVIPRELRNASGLALDIVFTNDTGAQTDLLRVCQVGECEEHLNERAAEVIPKLAERITQDGYVAVRAVGWPTQIDELEIPSFKMKIKLANGVISGTRDGKPVRIGSIRPARIVALYPVADARLLGVFASADGGPLQQVFQVLKVP